MDNETFSQMLPDSHVDDMLDRAIEVTREMLADGIENLVPMLHLRGVRRGGPYAPEDLVIGLFSDDNLPTREMVKMAGHGYTGVAKMLPIAALLISEVWGVKYKSEEEIDLNLPPSEHPDRYEALSFCILTIDGREASTMFQIERDSANHIQLGAVIQEIHIQDPNNETATFPILRGFYEACRDALGK